MQLVKQLHEARTGVPVIVLTVPQNPVDVDPDKGIHGVLSMPFSGYDLMTRIAAVHKESPGRSTTGRAGSSRCSPRRAASARRRSRSTSRSPLGQARAADRADRRQPPVRRPARRSSGCRSTRRRCSTCRPTGSPSRTSRTCSGATRPGIDILLAPPRVEMAEMVTIRDIEKILSLLRRVYELDRDRQGVGAGRASTSRSSTRPTRSSRSSPTTRRRSATRSRWPRRSRRSATRPRRSGTS